MFRFLKSKLRRPRRILFVRHFAIGDVIFTIPFLRLLKQKYPGARIELYTLVNGVFEGRSDFSSSIHMRDVPLKDLLDQGYWRTYWFSYEQDPSLHILDGYEQSTGLRLKDRRLAWTVLPEEREAAKARLSGLPRPLIGFSPTSGHALRSLPIDLIQPWIDRLQNVFGGTIVLTSESALNLRGCLNLSGQLSSIQELAAIIGGCDAWLTIDSGPLHLAQAQDVPTVGLFGCTLPELRVTQPSLVHAVRLESLDCLGCYHRIPPHAETLSSCSRGDLACMNQLKVDQVIQSLRDAMARKPDPVLLRRIATCQSRSSPLVTARQRKAIIQAYWNRIATYTPKARGGFLRRMDRSLRAWKKRS